MKVLLVDDDNHVLRGLQKLIDWEGLGCEVEVATNGKEGIEKIQEMDPDFTILDLVMPDIDGLQIMEYMYDNNYKSYTIVFSGHDKFLYAQKAMEFGAKEYILKPINNDKIKKIEEKVKELVSYKKTEKKIYTMISKGEIRASMINAIKNMNTLYFEHFFDSEIYAEFKKYNLDKSICLFLIETYFKVFKEIFFLEYIPFEENEVKEKFLEFNNSKSAEDFLQEIFINKINITREKKDLKKNLIYTTIINKINQEYMNEEFNISKLAYDLNLTTSYISQYFKKKTGYNLVNYITDIRLKKAKKLLKTTNLNLNEIALKVGYRNSRYFIRVFKKQTNFTPGEYRAYIY